MTSMPSGDPYCKEHGFIPCQCHYYGSVMSKVPTTIQMETVSQSNFPMCGTCGKHQGTCICGGSSDPYRDILTGVASSVSQVCVDITKPIEDVPVRKWADELRDTAKTAHTNPDHEPKSLYTYILERCKMRAKKGDYFAFFHRNSLMLWTLTEFEMAADLLRKDNFEVEVTPLSGDVRLRISWE